MARATGIENAIEVAAEETVVRAVESQVFAHALERVLSGPLIEEAVEDAMTSPAVERALANALDSEMLDRIWARASRGSLRSSRAPVHGRSGAWRPPQ